MTKDDDAEEAARKERDRGRAREYQRNRRATDPDFVERERLRKLTPEYRERRREHNRARRGDPRVRELERERGKGQRATPEYQNKRKRQYAQRTPAQKEQERARARVQASAKATSIRVAFAVLAGVPDACALCGGTEHLFLDHAHDDGSGCAPPRGILCSGCNGTLGLHEKGRKVGRLNMPDWPERADSYLADPPIFRALRLALEATNE